MVISRKVVLIVELAVIGISFILEGKGLLFVQVEDLDFLTKVVVELLLGHLHEDVVVDLVLVGSCRLRGVHLVDGRSQLSQSYGTHLKINFLDGEGVGSDHLLAVGVVIVAHLQLGLPCQAPLFNVDLVPTHIQVALQAPINLPRVQLTMLQTLYKY